MRIISGGQTGVDRAALAAATALGIATGGTMPLGYRCLDGDRPDIAALYGLTQAETADYPTRTRINVKSADATLLVAINRMSPGEVCTRKAAIDAGVPYRETRPEERFVSDTVDWVLNNNFRTLNVAGNSEKTSPGIYDRAYGFLIKVFTALVPAPNSIRALLDQLNKFPPGATYRINRNIIFISCGDDVVPIPVVPGK